MDPASWLSRRDTHDPPSSSRQRGLRRTVQRPARCTAPMTDKSARTESQEADPAEPEASAFAEGATADRRAGAPDIIYLPDQSQPLAAEPTAPTRRGKKGRHFGPRPVKDPLDAWLPATRCTKAQRKEADAAAVAAGISLNGLVRSRIFGGPGPRVHRNPGPNMAVLTRVLAELGKSGSNLNQIAHQLNAGEDADFPELSAALTEHRAAVAAVMSALGVSPDADNY